MGILTYFAKSHTWLLAVFAVGLGAPRWCQASHLVIGQLWQMLTVNIRIDVMGYVITCFIHSLGGRRWSISWDFAMALAWGLRCGPGCRVGYDLVAGQHV